MKQKKAIRVLSTVIGLTLAVGLACGTLAACGGGGDALVLSTDLPDGVFNPFFYTSGPDGDIMGQTMIGMLSTDEKGDPVAGEEEPCVALDYSVIKTGTRENMTGPDDYSNYYTDYYFAVKDNIKFSDGTPLTIKDVLFNIYMYLDPAYTGSATMYSVDIQGLAAYRTQTTDTAQQEHLQGLLDEFADGRINAIRTWANEKTTTLNNLAEESRADLDKIDELFKEELSSDWNNAQNADLKEYEKYVDENGNKIFTENWQIFLYNYGLISLTTNKKPDPADPVNKTIKWYTVSNNYNANTAKTKEALTQEVFANMLGGKSSASDTYKKNVVAIITGYATASTFRQYLNGEGLKEIIGDELKVRTVEGIKTYKATSIPGENGTTKDLGKELDILHIRINGEDPKAIQNFGFTVAPLHYYSRTAAQFSLEEGKEYFGVEWGDTDFMDSVRYIQVPLGAGPYCASNSDGDIITDLDQLKNSKNEFFRDNIVYYESNENFFLGAPKIKKLRYKVISTSLLYEAVKTGEVNYASPSGTSEMINNLENADKDKLDYTLTDNLGYGYIGINASFVHDINIRKAIMHAMDIDLCIDYYGGGTLASPIYRPMSKTIDWCYPSYLNEAYYPYDGTGQTSLALATRAGYTPDSNGFLVGPDGERLKFTFTIAGDSEDHPAYGAMQNAAEVLNGIGFDVTVTRDSTALSKLSAGRLEVWAAAWSSSSDPDMYQVYHKDSSATSILAWGFPWIETDGTSDENNLLEELAKRIEEGRQTSDRDERKQIYAGTPQGTGIEGMSALDLVMELAVELPTYQRKALYVYQRDLFDDASIELFAQSTAFQSPLNKIWLIGFAE